MPARPQTSPARSCTRCATASSLGQVHLSEVSQGGEVGHATSAAAEGAGAGYVQVLDERPSGVAWVVATGEPLIVPDARGSQGVRQDLVERFDVASMAYVPIGWGGEVRYVAILISHEPRDFDAEAIEFAETLANQAAAALALLESERRRAAQAERDAALTRAAAALNASLELVEVLETLAREADHAMGGALAGVYLADGSGGGVATAGHNVDPSWTGIVLSRGEGVAGRVLTTGKPFVTNAYQTEIETAHESLGAIKTAAGVPMVWNGELKGALSVGFTEMRRVTDEDLRTLEAIAAFAVVACQNAEAYQLARVAATTDALTGLINHGALHLRVREEISRARRTGAPLACLLLDLDDFKTVNDERGHQAGDEQLRVVADALRAELRDHDIVARYGGDEFVVLLPGADGAGGRAVADRIAAAVPMRVLDRRRPLERAAVGRRAARPRRPRAAAGQAHGQAARRGRQRRARAGARARRGARRLARGDHARVLGDGRGLRVEPRRRCSRCPPSSAARSTPTRSRCIELGDDDALVQAAARRAATGEARVPDRARAGDLRDPRAAPARRDLPAHAGRPAGRDRRRRARPRPAAPRPAPTPSCRCCGPGARTA